MKCSRCSAGHLASHIWIIGHRSPHHGFYTSDEPVTRYGNLPRSAYGNDGIASKGVEVQLPISHDYCLTFYERSHFKWLEGKDGTVMEYADPQLMVYCRQWPVKYATRFVFCRDNDFELARQICAEEPHWRDPDRKRVTSNHDDEPIPRGVN